MADSGVVDLDSDFMISGRADFNVLNREVLASFPGDGSLDSVSWRSVMDVAACAYLACDGLDNGCQSRAGTKAWAQLTFPTVSAGMMRSLRRIH